MSTISTTSQAALLAQRGVAFAPQIAHAARKYGVDPQLLAAVAAQETGGPGSNAGRNVVGDGGHGRGVFQIDDRYHDFARTRQAMEPDANADYAAGMISGLLKRYGGDVHKALSAYNAGSPDATGTVTQWQDGKRLGYADSVLRHYAALSGTTPSTTQRSTEMHLSLGGIVKGVTTGLETLVETGNPYIAAGAGAIACFSSSGSPQSANAGSSSSSFAPQLSPLLDEMQAENPYEQNHVNELSSYAELVAA